MLERGVMIKEETDADDHLFRSSEETRRLDISAGDYVSTVSMPVRSFPARVDIHVRKV